MHIEVSVDLDVPQLRVGFADVYRGGYKGHPVAVKVLRTYRSSDLQIEASVNPFLVRDFRNFRSYTIYRDSAGKLFFGNTYGTQTSCRCLV